MTNKTRFLSDGQVAVDLSENPKAAERKAREVEAAAIRDRDQRESWGRPRLERELSQAFARRPVAVMNGRQIWSPLDLHGVDLSGQDLSGLNLSGVNLHGAKLAGAILTGCLLIGANLHDADLKGATLEKVNAQTANFHGACICGATVSDSNFRNSNLSEACFEGTYGLDLEERQLTEKERDKAVKRQRIGERVLFLEMETKVVYVGPTMDGANLTHLRPSCQRPKNRIS